MIGFGSLVDPGWAKETMPNLANFRTGKVLDFCRVFNLVSIVNIKRGYAKEPYLATCTAVRKLGSLLLVSLFEVPRSEYAAFARREIRLRHEVVDYVEEGKVTGKGVLCTEFSDEEYFLNRCQVISKVLASCISLELDDFCSRATQVSIFRRLVSFTEENCTETISSRSQGVILFRLVEVLRPCELARGVLNPIL